jgi:Xaa-Pro aminopeptidase
MGSSRDTLRDVGRAGAIEAPAAAPGASTSTQAGHGVQRAHAAPDAGEVLGEARAQSIAPEMLAEHRAIQLVAREVLADLAPTIGAADTELSIAERATEALRSRGVTETWYHNCPALVLLGSRSCLSMSGRDYVPAREPVGQTNLVTVDLSPLRAGARGDCARSFFIENGRATAQPLDAELARGKAFLESLHAAMPAFVDRSTSFHELFEWANARIVSAGFENLDFRGNVGHSLATGGEHRRFIEAGSEVRAGDVPFFTFEPHVRAVGGRWGFKHENVFFFASAAGGLEEL